jgi:hypothetical protein
MLLELNCGFYLVWIILGLYYVSVIYFLGMFQLVASWLVMQGLRYAVLGRQELQLYQNQGVMTEGIIMERFTRQGDETS